MADASAALFEIINFAKRYNYELRLSQSDIKQACDNTSHSSILDAFLDAHLPVTVEMIHPLIY